MEEINELKKLFIKDFNKLKEWTKNINKNSTRDNVNNTEINVFADSFRVLENMEVTVKNNKKNIKQVAYVNGNVYSLSINLNKWAKHTTVNQIIECTKIFWYCYPKMYERFAIANTPRDVKFIVQNEGYEVAYAAGDSVYIHDQWLERNQHDFDCLTHEFSHVIQNGWSDEYVPTYGNDTYMIERFADYCRFVYAFNMGYYNNREWELQTKYGEDSYVSSVRFWVWLDYNYSTKNIDIMKRIFQAIGYEYDWARTKDWRNGGKAWKNVFKGTAIANKTLGQLWEMYASSDFSILSSKTDIFGAQSPLEIKYNVRNIIRGR